MPDFLQELLNKCHKNMEIILTAKDRQAAEANKNASILLEELDLEKEREEMKKAAAARKRDKKKQKKKKKLQAEKEAETNVKNMAEKENSDDSSEPERKISENGGQLRIVTSQFCYVLKFFYVFDITQLSKHSVNKHCDTQSGWDDWITFKQNSEFIDREIITAHIVASCCEMTGFGEMYRVFICFVSVCWFSHYYPFSRSLGIKTVNV